MKKLHASGEACAIGLVAVVGMLCSAASADVMQVPSQFPTIQDALDEAQTGDTVIVADGVYTGFRNVDLDYQGKAIVLRSENGPATCIIDCDASQENPHRAVTFNNGETREAVFSGFTVRNGSTPQGAILDRFNGAAVLATEESSPTIRNCVFESNWAGCWGGAVCCSHNSHALIDSCRFTDNHGDDEGGAIFAWNGSSPVVMNSLFVSNSTTNVGGGICNFGGEMKIINCTFIGNDSPWASGIYSWNSIVENCIIHSNTDTTQVGGGGIVRYSLVQGGHEGEGNIDADPMFVDVALGDFRLQDGSAAIDMGDEAALPIEATTDLAGNPRFIDDPDAAGVTGGSRPPVDMGAFERQLGACPADFDQNGSLNSTDLFTFMEALMAGAADFDGDGFTTSQDLFAYLIAFQNGCP